MWSMFEACSGLTSIDLSMFDISEVTEMKDIFGYCRVLTIIDTLKNGAFVLDLPSEEGEWTDSTGEIYTTLPENVTESIVLTKVI